MKSLVLKIKSLLGYHKHEGPGVYIRHDFDSLGFGTGYDYKLKCIGAQICYYRFFWVNIYKRFPFPKNFKKYLECHFGIIHGRKYSKRNKFFQIDFDGPRIDLLARYTLIAGPIFFGSWTPTFIKNYIRKKDDKHYAEMEEALYRIMEEDR